MTEDEHNEFLAGLAKCTNMADKKRFANDFYRKMIEKYGNQFEPNGFIDDLIDVLNTLKDC